MCEVLNSIQRWDCIATSLGVPSNQIKNIKKQCEDNESRCGVTAWQYWLDRHPAPSWALVADAVYENTEHEALKELKKKHPEGMW